MISLRCCRTCAIACAIASLFVINHHASGATSSDVFATVVIEYDPGEGSNPAYQNSAAVLGSPERYTGEGIFPGVVSPFNPPFGTDEILSIGRGGWVIVAFSSPITDDPANPFGIDLLVFGNAGFIDGNYPNGIVDGLFGNDGGTIAVSADGKNWIDVTSVEADGMFPTLGYLDSGPYDPKPGTAPSDFTRPVDPSLALSDFIGLTHEEVIALYAGSGGGAGVDLAGTGLSAISFVRVSLAVDAPDAMEIDAFADVASIVNGDIDGDGDVDFDDFTLLLASWGSCPEPPAICPADLDHDGDVDFDDFTTLLANWS